MFAFSSVLTALCLAGVPSDAPTDTSPAAEAAQPTVRPKAFSVPSAVREAELNKTLAKRKAFRQRNRGHASRQIYSIAPTWSATMSQMMMLAASQDM